MPKAGFPNCCFSNVNLNNFFLQDFSEDDANFRKHTASLKPSLTPANKDHRFAFACGEVVGCGPQFHHMYDRIHLDEKWFYMQKPSSSYLLSQEEQDPHRKTKHKSHIPKLMFFCAVCRPRWDFHRKCMSSGRICLEPFAERRPAQRSSVNRPAGTLEWKEYTVTIGTYTQMLKEKLFPAIKEKWVSSPYGEDVIRIQHDNAPPHRINCAELEEYALTTYGLKVKLYFQPPNSPDLNVLDLGFFASIQSLYYKKMIANMDQLVGAVFEAFEEETPTKLNSVFCHYSFA